jgi:hypothetical protein
VNYWLTVFSESTWEQFRQLSRKVCAYNESKFGSFPKIAVGDRIVCYVSGNMVWAGLLSVEGDRYRDETRIYDSGVFPIRIPVGVEVMTDLENAVPMAELEGKLSFFTAGSTAKQWAPHVRNSPRKYDTRDGEAIAAALKSRIGE